MDYSSVISVITILYFIIDQINSLSLYTTSVTINDGTFQDLDTSTIKNWSSQDDRAKFMSTTSHDNDDSVKSTFESKTSSHPPSTQQDSEEQLTSITSLNTRDKQTTEVMVLENSSERQVSTTIESVLLKSIKESTMSTTETAETMSLIRSKIGHISMDKFETSVSVSSVSHTPTSISVGQNQTKSVPQYTMIDDETTVIKNNFDSTSSSSSVEGIEKSTTQFILTETKIDISILRSRYNSIDLSTFTTEYINEVSSTEASTDETVTNRFDNSIDMSTLTTPFINEVSSTEANTDETVINHFETHENSIVTEEWFKGMTTPKQHEKYIDAITHFETTQNLSIVKNYTESNASISQSNEEVDLTSTLSYFATNDESINYNNFGEEVTLSTTTFDDSRSRTKKWTNFDVVTFPTVVGTKSTQDNNNSFYNPGTRNNHSTKPTGTTFFSTTETVQTAAAVADITVPLIVAGCGFILLLILSLIVWIKGRRNRGRVQCHRLRSLDVRKTITSPADVPRFMMAVNKFPDHEIL